MHHATGRAKIARTMSASVRDQIRYVRPVVPVHFPATDPEWDLGQNTLHGRLCELLYQVLVATLGPTGEACTEVIVSGATVAALGRPGDELLRAADELTITLAMSSMNDVLAAVHASDQGDLTLVRATNVGDPAPGADSSYGSAASFCSGERGAAG